LSLWQSVKKLNLPNKLTLMRIVAAPVLMGSLLTNTVWGQYVALLVFVAAALTDYWDGKLARRYNLVTNFGRIMDPLADKLLMATAFICFVQLGWARAWMVILIIGREFAITGLRVLAAAEGRVIAASTSGKNKTISQMVAVISILVVNVVVSSLQAWLPPWEVTLKSLGVFGDVLIVLADHLPYWSMVVAAVLSLYSGVEYLIQNIELFHDRSV
jgi:CDP-diacylglycerol--glycerol-3-phosphate 3-phosphatidyltransferase